MLDLEIEELYYPCSENKGADQLRSYCEADLRLCFRLCRLLVFSCGGSFPNLNRLLLGTIFRIVLAMARRCSDIDAHQISNKLFIEDH